MDYQRYIPIVTAIVGSAGLLTNIITIAGTNWGMLGNGAYTSGIFLACSNIKISDFYANFVAGIAIFGCGVPNAITFLRTKFKSAELEQLSV
ncbi:hypothetical protein HZS_4398 [Henneguya salminicola]|nr:hypothetical protein HZS_4398 [Henneguya salminicola]